MKTAVHSSHTGIEGCLKRARECLFWPGMSADIKHFISTCDTCRTYEISQSQEILMNHELPSRQWEKIGVDLFEHDGKYFLITVDYFSNYWEIDSLENTGFNGYQKAKITLCSLRLSLHWTSVYFVIIPEHFQRMGFRTSNN